MRPFPKPMSADEELARARELVEIRRRAWACMLDYPPFVEAIVEHLGAELGDSEPPTAQLAALRDAASALRDRDVRKTLEGYARARDALAEALHKHRSEAPLFRALAAEVRAIASCRAARRTPVLEVRTPPRGSKVFRRYASAVRRVETQLVTARQRFVAANLRLVVTIARRYNNGFLTQADLIQEGTLGLLRAVDGYDPGRGTRFSTYAAWWIKHGITRALANHGLTVRVPANVLGLRAQLVRVEQAFIGEQGRSPTDRELAQILGVPSKTVANARQAVHTSVELPNDADWLADEDAIDVDSVLDEPVVVGEMVDLVDRLPGIEGAVIRKRFALDGEAPMTLAEIGEVHCLSRERIRQIEKQALLRMRGELRSRGIFAGA